MNEQAQKICDQNTSLGLCGMGCPLTQACVMRPGDTKESFGDRVNRAAESIEDES